MNTDNGFTAPWYRPGVPSGSMLPNAGGTEIADDTTERAAHAAETLAAAAKAYTDWNWTLNRHGVVVGKKDAHTIRLGFGMYGNPYSGDLHKKSGRHIVSNSRVTVKGTISYLIKQGGI